MTVSPVFGVAESIGRRKAQEDYVRWVGLSEGDAAAHLPRVTVIADGMGGHAAGDVASQVATKAFLDACMQGRPGEPKLLSNALDSANQAISRQVDDAPDQEGMGCTLVAVEVRDSGTAFRWISVGDSLLLSVGAHGIKRLNADHSFREELARATAAGEDVTHLPSGNVLRSAVMGGHMPLIDHQSSWRAFQPGETLILATDGLETLTLDMIRQIVASGGSATDIAAKLVKAVEKADKPRQDNTTVAVFKTDLPATPGKPAPLAKSPPRLRQWPMVVAAIIAFLALATIAVVGLYYWQGGNDWRCLWPGACTGSVVSDEDDVPLPDGPVDKTIADRAPRADRDPADGEPAARPAPMGPGAAVPAPVADRAAGAVNGPTAVPTGGAARNIPATSTPPGTPGSVGSNGNSQASAEGDTGTGGTGGGGADQASTANAAQNKPCDPGSVAARCRRSPPTAVPPSQGTP